MFLKHLVNTMRTTVKTKSSVGIKFKGQSLKSKTLVHSPYPPKKPHRKSWGGKVNSFDGVVATTQPLDVIRLGV